MTSRKIRGLNTTLNKGTGVFNHDQIDQALLEIEDTFDRCLVPFMLLEGVAKQLRDEVPFELKEITIGVKEKNWTEVGRSLFAMLRPEAEITKDYITLKINNVPVIIWIIHRNYKFFKHPDFRWYKRTEFYLPNPFENYWKARFLIR